jgi:hypothetical protein
MRVAWTRATPLAGIVVAVTTHQERFWSPDLRECGGKGMIVACYLTFERECAVGLLGRLSNSMLGAKSRNPTDL